MSDSGFGDFEDADAFDTAPPDAEQVARKLAEYNGDNWDELTDEQQAGRVAVLVLLLAWLRRQGALR
jgi:hypothetical protein